MFPTHPPGHALSPLAVLATIPAAALIVGGLVYALETSKPPVPEPAFAAGQMVRMKAFGVTGMIIDGYCVSSGCRYDVRFASMQIKIPNGGLFSNGGLVDFAPVSRVNVREFEIEAN